MIRSPLRRLGAALAAALVLLVAVPAAAVALSARDRADLARVQDYLDGIHTMQARFLQVAPDGSFSSGTIYLSRPGRLRVQYDPPVPVLLVTTDVWLIFFDSELGQVSYLPLGTTPAAFLVKDRVTLGQDVEVLGLERGPGTLRVTLADDSLFGSGELTLTFGDAPLELKKWAVKDSSNEVTHVALVDPVFGIPLDPDLFKFVDPNPDLTKDR